MLFLVLNFADLLTIQSIKYKLLTIWAACAPAAFCAACAAFASAAAFCAILEAHFPLQSLGASLTLLSFLPCSCWASCGKSGCFSADRLSGNPHTDAQVSNKHTQSLIYTQFIIPMSIYWQYYIAYRWPKLLHKFFSFYRMVDKKFFLRACDTNKSRSGGPPVWHW